MVRVEEGGAVIPHLSLYSCNCTGMAVAIFLTDISLFTKQKRKSTFSKILESELSIAFVVY